jgi:hypothetical protein
VLIPEHVSHRDHGDRYDGHRDDGDLALPFQQQVASPRDGAGDFVRLEPTAF